MFMELKLQMGQCRRKLLKMHMLGQFKKISKLCIVQMNKHLLMNR